MKAKQGDAGAERAFEADPDAVYAYVARFFASLAAAGVEHVVLSPGSRSTPLAICAERCPTLRTWIELDERAAAFFALGIAKATGKPAALVCTSGTAAANYLPAIVEAHHARVPLVVLTADRPSELRDFGAGQTIEQPGLYGRLPRWCVEVPIPETGRDALRHAEILAARAVEMAAARPAGAVHLNWPLREPLAPRARSLAAADAANASASANGAGATRFSRAALVAAPEDVDELVALVSRSERGVVCCGPMDADARLASALAAFSTHAGWPIFADPASQLRRGAWTRGAAILDAGDLLARAPGFSAAHPPEVVIRIGDPPVSKAQRLWLEAAAPRAVWWLDEGGQWGEPSRQATRVVRGGAASLLEAASSRLADRPPRARGWCEAFVAANARARSALGLASASGAADSATGAALRVDSGSSFAAAVVEALPANGQLFASNSMPIRLLDLALTTGSDPLRVFCNRGASGIDGITSTALGVAAATGRPTLLFTGDLAFLHDLTGLLLARREAIPLVIAVLDDGGGGIFSFLPVAEQGEAIAFDRLFRTPHGIDLARAAALFELDYEAVGSASGLAKVLAAALARPRVSIVHVKVDPEENTRQFRAAIARACSAVDIGIDLAAGAGAGADANAGRSVFVEAGGIRLHAVVDEPRAPAPLRAGAPIPEILVLHGFTGAAESMEGVGRHLSDRARVARLDLVGHGASEAPLELAPYGMEACATQIAEAAHALGFARPYLIGYSMGGRAALAAALARPRAFAGLVLVGATAGIADPTARAERIAADRALADSIEQGGLERFVEAWMAQPLFASQARLGREVLARARRQRLANRPAALANSLRGMGAGAQTPLHDRLGHYAGPVLLVVGEEDLKFRAIAQDLAQALPDARIEVIEGAGHAAHLEAPDRFAAVVRDFVGAAS